MSSNAGAAVPEHALARTMTKRLIVFVTKAIVYLAAAWWIVNLVIVAFDIPWFVLPPPAKALQSIRNLPSYYFHNSVVTLEEAASGATVGFLGGLLLGIVIRYSGRLGRALNPLILASQVFPKEALAPIFLVFFGFGITHKIIISALICFFPVVVNTTVGLNATPRHFEQLMQVLGASNWERFRYCHLPFAAPYILASLRICATLSVIGAVVGEFVGSSAGLGHVIRGANSDIGIDRVYAALLLLGVMGAAFYGSAALMERVIFARYTKTR